MQVLSRLDAARNGGQFYGWIAQVSSIVREDEEEERL